MRNQKMEAANLFYATNSNGVSFLLNFCLESELRKRKCSFKLQTYSGIEDVKKCTFTKELPWLAYDWQNKYLSLSCFLV